VVDVTYHCPYCGAVTTLERRARLADKSVTAEPLEGWEYAATTDAFEAADGVELVCLGDGGDDAGPAEGGDGGPAERGNDTVPAERGDGGPAEGGDGGPDPAADGCGRTYYLSFVKYADGEELDPSGEWLEDDPSFGFLR